MCEVGNQKNKNSFLRSRERNPMTTTATSNPDSATRDRIIEQAQSLFFARGFTNVTTGEIAAGLGISKKTLYQYFESKEDLLRESMVAFRNELARQLSEVIDDRRTEFFDKLRGVLTVLGSHVARLERPHLEDMHRKAPHLVREMEQFRRERVLPMFERLFAQGVRRGMLRRDIDSRLFLQMIYVLIENILTPSVVVNMPYTLAEVFRSILSVTLEGMLTEEGRRGMTNGE